MPKTLPFVWEIGCEEIPADWLPDTLDELRRLFEKGLAEARLSSPVETYGTPRRLVVHLPRLAEKQADRREQVSGPPARMARGPGGEWSPAALGFARKNGVDPAALRILTTEKGDYVGFVRQVKGRSAREILPGLMAATLRGLTFPKFMNWDAELPDGRGAFPFARPIRWMVTLLGKRVLPFEIKVGEGRVRSSNKTRGHRFLAPAGRKAGAPFAVSSFQSLRQGLKRHSVLLDSGERRGRLERELHRIEKKLGARRAPGLKPELVADLVEWPGVVVGRYPEEFLVIPEEVRHTVLIHHQKYFPLEGKPAFIAPTNMPSDPKGYIRRGCERVVVARLRDAHFFWQEDLKRPLAARQESLGRVQFHEKLGTYKEKVERLVRLSEWLAEASEVPTAPTRRAAELAKCDLTTEMVKEFTELQGVVGGLYLREEGQPEEIWRAVYSHYRPLTLDEDADFPLNAVGVLVSLADKLDSLAGMFSVGVAPTGSKDPFGLRRAAIGVLRLLLQSESKVGLRLELPLQELLHQAGRPFGGEPRAALGEFFTERLRFVLGRSYRYDEVNAVLATGALSRPVRDLAERCDAVAALRGSADFEALSSAFKRVRNILASERPGAVDVSALAEPAERELWSAFQRVEPKAVEDLERQSYRDALRTLSSLRAPVDGFFDKVLVMSPDEKLRQNRLALLNRLRELFTRVADLSEIVTGAAA
jgi:glycyl-tRNA synthetase beta chain